MKRLTLIQIIANADDFKFFKYKAKLLRNAAFQPAPNAANGILKTNKQTNKQTTKTIAVPLNYLSNFWRSLEIPLINCKK